MRGRVDAVDKARGASIYAADVVLPGTVHVAMVRSLEAHAHINGIDTATAASMPGVVGVFTAADLHVEPYGRRVRDVPALARDKVRFVGERVAAVVAETPRQAEAAAGFVEVDYDELPAVTAAAAALEPGAPRVHDAPWDYPEAVVRPEDGANLQSRSRTGDEAGADAAIAAAAHVVEATYTTPSGHQGYLEPQACVVAPRADGAFDVWATDKRPYHLRAVVADCLGIDPDRIRLQPVAIGGDFGGKGGFGDVPLCIELARLVGRPVKSVHTYAEDLTATNPRHPVTLRVRLACDGDGTFRGLHVDALVDGGAYAGFKPMELVALGGIQEAGSCYRIPATFVQQRVAYTTSVPRGHMRAPGRPEAVFALESAIDELAAQVGMAPAELRRRNLVGDGEPNAHGKVWAEARGAETLTRAIEAATAGPALPAGWLAGTGHAVAEHKTPVASRMGLRVTPRPDGGVLAEVAVAETGTGSHTVLREGLVRALGVPRESVEVAQLSTSEFAYDHGVGGSRVTSALSIALARLAEAWRDRRGDEPVVVELDEEHTERVTSFCAQVAHVAVHPDTGQIKVLEVVTAVDVAEIVNPAAHQMQIDGGTIMGFGFACLEDLQIEDGQVWAANLGEFKIPSTRDVPALRTVLVDGGAGVGLLNTKAVGEVSNLSTAAAIANAVADATGVRLRDLPLGAEALWHARRTHPRPDRSPAA